MTSFEALRDALADRYTIERELGQGGMATVYLAHDRRHGRPVAIKVLRPELAAAVGAKRFAREITLLARLRHPFILPLHDSGEAGTSLYYVMSYIDGESLGARVGRLGRLALGDALKITREIADALAYAHGEGVVHRDVKPENILISPQGHALLADFGIARGDPTPRGKDDQLTGFGLAVGTPAYMSPEQVLGEGNVGGASDIYSLGVTLFEMLAGRTPFTTEGSWVAVAAQHLTAAVPALATFGVEVPPHVEQAVRRALAKDPGDRFATAAEFATALDASGPVAPISAGVPAPRRRAIAAVLSTGAVVAAVLAVVAFVQAREAREQTAIAQEQTGLSEQEAARAEEQARLATVRQLAAASVANLLIDPELSTLLALGAVRRSGQDVLPEAEDALHRSLEADRLLATVPNGGNGIAHFSPNGDSFVTLGEDPTTVQLWNAVTLEPGPTLAGHSDLVFDSVYDAEGSRIATTSADGTVRIWDAATAETLAVLDVEGPPPLIPAFSRDGTMLAASSASSPTSASGVVRVWDLGTQEVIWTLDPPEGTRQTLNLEFSPDGSLLAVAPETWFGAEEFGAHVWDLSTGRLDRILTGHDWDIKDVGFTPDGSLLATGSWDTTVRLWNVATWENVRTYFGHETSVWDIQISADGTKIASSGTNEALVWDLETTETLASLVGHTGIVDGIDLGPDGNLLLTASMVDATTRLWDIGPTAGPELFGLPGPPVGTSAGVQFSPDGTTLVTTRDLGSVTMWEFPSGSELRSVVVPTDLPDLLTFDPQGKFVAIGGAGQSALLDVVDGAVAPIELTQESDEMAEGPVALSASGVTAVATTEGVRLFRTPHATEGEMLTDLPAYRLTFDPEARILVMSLDDGKAGMVEVQDVVTGDTLATLTAHNAPVWDVEFTSDGTRFITASLDSTVTVWDATTFELIRRLEGHTGQVFDLAVDPTKPEVATVSDDGTVKIWDLDTGAVRLTLPGRGAVSVAYSPDGRYLATAGVEGRVDVFILDVQELAEVAQGRLTRWWTAAECVQYLDTTECPPSPPDL